MRGVPGDGQGGKMNREELRRLAAGLPRGLGGEGALLPLAKTNDPFMVGAEIHWAMALWFKRLWEEFGYERGKHVRDIHYDVATRLSYTYAKHDGTPYLHTKACYTHLQSAAKYARHLGIMGDVLDDKRSNPVKIFAKPRRVEQPGGFGLGILPSSTPGFSTGFVEDEWMMPRVHITPPPEFPFPEAQVHGYDYDASDQPVHIEVWVEKTKAEAELERVCLLNDVNLQWGSGTFGIEVARGFVNRVREWGKPARLIYLCDYDPAGMQMPVSVGRQIEFIMHQTGEIGLDVRVDVLGITTKQITDMVLPRKPFEEQEHKWAQTRADNFEKRLGEGGTELNAIGDSELGTIVEDRIREYRDEGLRDAVRLARGEAQEGLDRAVAEAQEEFSDELEGLREEVDAVAERYRLLAEKLNGRMARELESASEKRISLRGRIRDRLDEVDDTLPDYPEGEFTEPFKDDHYLFDATRPYLDQMRHYRRRQGREGEWDLVTKALEEAATA
jgi:vacuolar-type H+-ATPase subunit H